MLAATLPDAVLALLGVALTGSIAAAITAWVNRRPAADTAAGALVTGAADLNRATLDLVEATAEAGAELADALRAERDDCYADRLVLIELAEEHELDPATIASIRRRTRPGSTIDTSAITKPLTEETG